MQREKLQKQSTDNLKKYARRLGITDNLSVPIERSGLIEAILAHEDKEPKADNPVDLGKGGAEASARMSEERQVSSPATPVHPPQTLAAVGLQQIMENIQRQQQEMQVQQRLFMEQQQKQFMEALQAFSTQQVQQVATQGPSVPRELSTNSTLSSPTQRVMHSAATGDGAQGNGTSPKWLASQIAEYGGTEEENVLAWIRRVDKVAQVHSASDAVTLLAASSRFTKAAKRWYELQEGPALETWIQLKQDLKKMFERRTPFYKSMQRIEARVWQQHKESFDSYAIEKLNLIKRIDVNIPDTINLLIGGIPHGSLRATAITIQADSVEEFLEKMRHIAEGYSEIQTKRSNSNQAKERTRTNNCKNCGKGGHTHQECRAEPSCFYCKERGHRRFDCPVLRKRKTTAATPQQPAVRTTACVSSEETETVATIAAEEDVTGDRLTVGSPFTKVIRLNGEPCHFHALLDTGSPVSFVHRRTLEKIRKTQSISVNPNRINLRNLSNKLLNVDGTISVKLTLADIPNSEFDIILFVLEEQGFEGDIIIGREFFENAKLTLIFQPSSSVTPNTRDRIGLFSVLPLCIEEESSVDPLSQVIEEMSIDYDNKAKRQLKDVILSVQSREISPVEDNYSVRVNLRDSSIYAYAPRRFAHAERVQIREITEDLLRREIIQPSVSPYCARVVPVKKKNGQLRLCVDLRPLNSRIEKQKYPFPLIEDCLTRLSNKSVFTLLDLKDGFHQIKVHEESTKYFSFATPDGQYEFKKLPFGYSEAPAEFEKRLIQVLNPLVRQDKILIYIDDILIPSSTIEENLTILEEVLIQLKRYGFELNFSKCQFLKKEIEFLGYIIRNNQITLTTRHSEAIRNFVQPRNVHEIQRFLGLCSYFRRFIQNFALKAKPLYNLLKKNAEFDFDEQCTAAYTILKKELSSLPSLYLYNPTAETELHTDACSRGLGAILMQKQRDKVWAPVAFFSQATNKSERAYHSFELEMLAIVRAIERFHIYLFGLSFTIVTDCIALVYAVNKANLNPRIARWTLALQNYTFKVTHRSADRMVHVDALSRAVAYVNAMPLERELEYRQLSDPRIKEISLELEKNELKKYRLIDGLVYKVDKDNSLKFVIPESMTTNVLRAHHDDMAHCGTEKTFQGIRSNYWFPSMRKKISGYIENCLTCLMANNSPHSLERETQLMASPSLPQEIMHVDHLGPLPRTKEGFRYILVLADSFTRFTWLFPTASTSSAEAIQCIKKVIDLFGKPGELVTDRGTAFTSTEFFDFVNKQQIYHRKVAVASPWANGIVERINRFIMSSLTKLLNTQEEWAENLGRLQYIINNTYHSVTKASPSTLMLGFQQRNHADIRLTKFTQALLEIDENLEKKRDSKRLIAETATNLIRKYNKHYKDADSRKPSLYKVGDYVLVRNLRGKPGESPKLNTKYKGPYQVAKTLGCNRYVIKDVPGFNQAPRPMDTILSSDKLKPWNCEKGQENENFK